MTQRGTTQTLTATFRTSPGGPLVDPTSLSLIIKNEAHATVLTATPVHDGLGLYRYEWAIPVDQTPGTYTAVWTATLPGNSTSSVGYETIEVTEFLVPDVPEFAGCVWPMDPACADEEWNGFPTQVQQRALALASATLQRLTGNRVSNCPVTVRPASAGCMTRYGYDPFLQQPFVQPLNWGGTWYNTACCSQIGQGVRLPGPIGRVDEVKVDGAVLDPTDYAVVGGFLVWRGEGGIPWNLNQNLALPDSEYGTWSITYLQGFPVDALGAYAVGVLALEYARACTGSGQCRLPDNVTSVVRQGIALEVASGSFPNGETGINEVDSYIALWNPRHLTREATVWSPDMMRYPTGG